MAKQIHQRVVMKSNVTRTTCWKLFRTKRTLFRFRSSERLWERSYLIR